MTDYNDINIFDPKYLYPSEVREEKPKEKKQHEMTAVERRLHYKKQAQESREIRLFGSLENAQIASLLPDKLYRKLRYEELNQPLSHDPEE